MQQRGANLSMEAESENQSSLPQHRTRNNAKSKVLVRSHAMREETSPPREPTPTTNISPCIKLTPSPASSPVSGKPVLVFSPSISRGNSPCRSPLCTSPTSTLVPSPASRCSPQSISPQNPPENSDTANLQVETENNYERSGSPKYLNKLNRQNLERDGKVPVKTEIIVEEASHCNRKLEKLACDCSNPNCIKCLKGQERNFNNNLSSNVNNNVVSNTNTLSVTRSNSKGKLRHQSSSQGSFDSNISNSPCLSRDNSCEQYTDTTGVDLNLFIPETLNKNAKDRALMLRIEQELVTLAKDKGKTHFKFPPMSSYQRMLVHRCAAYFGMEHNIESSGKCVVVNKTKNTRIPDVEFKAYIKEDIVFSEEPRRSILKRDSNSIEDYNFKSPDRQHSLENRRSKSFEEREEEYEKLRGGNSAEEFWAEVPWSSTDSDNSARFKLLPPDHHYRHSGRLLKVHSEETNETVRPCVAKSYSFGGYGGSGNVSLLSRGDSVISTHSVGPRLFTKQDSAASSVSWRLSPSSSGYKSQSQRSESVTPSPTSTPFLSSDSMRQDSSMSDPASNPSLSEHQDTQLVWAVTDIHDVPKGSIIINPQTGQPFKNQDGSIYHYDPNNPPVGYCEDLVKSPPSPQKTTSAPLQKSIKERPPSPKKRSRSSPTKKSNLINSSTSPSLPFTPPLVQNRPYTFPQSGEAAPATPQQYPVYSGSFGPSTPQDSSVQLYQQPCIVYAPYNVPVPAQYDGRIEPQMPPEIPPGGYFVNIQDSGSAHQITYQTPPQFWNQQPVTFYQNPPQASQPPQTQRFSYPVPGQQGFLPAPYQPNYIQHPNQTPQSQELVPVYPQQPVQVVYPTPPTQQNPVMYSNQTPVMYTQNPVYPNPMYPTHTIPQNIPHYPQSTSTPNSCTSSVSNTPYCRQMQEIPMQPNFSQIATGMSHLNLNSSHLSLASAPSRHGFNYAQNSNKGTQQMQQFEGRPRNTTPKGNKFSTPKNYSSQNSTGTNSPATTVIAGYCNSGMYRTPPETPPIQNAAFGYHPNFVPSMLYRQTSNVSNPGTNRSSRSPTPASDLDKQRMALPPTVYQGMPYVLQPDNKIVPGRGQPSSYRQAPLNQQAMNQGSEGNKFNFHRCTKGRKGRGKMSGLPPSGKQCM